MSLRDAVHKTSGITIYYFKNTPVPQWTPEGTVLTVQMTFIATLTIQVICQITAHGWSFLYSKMIEPWLSIKELTLGLYNAPVCHIPVFLVYKITFFLRSSSKHKTGIYLLAEGRQTFHDHESKGKYVAKLVRPVPARTKDSAGCWGDVGYQSHATQDNHQKNRWSFSTVKKLIWK